MRPIAFRAARYTGRRSAARASLAALVLGCSDAGAPLLSAPGDVLWRQAVVAPVHEFMGLPATDGSLVFFDVENTMSAFDVRTGRRVWSTPVRSRPIAESRGIVYHSSLAIMVVEFREFVAIHTPTGAIRWRSRPDSLRISAMGALDEFAYYTGSRSGVAYALNRDDGSVIWRAPLNVGRWDHGSVMGAAVSGERVFVNGWFRLEPLGELDLFVIALDRRTGRELWRHETTEGEHTTIEPVAIAKDLVIVADGDGRALTALDRESGEHRWSTYFDRSYMGPENTPAIVGNMVYLANHDRYVHALDLETGARRWRAHAGGSPLNLAVCGDYVIANDLAADFFDRHSGRFIRTVLSYDQSPIEYPEMLSSHFISVGNRLLASGNRAVYALRC